MLSAQVLQQWLEAGKAIPLLYTFCLVAESRGLSGMISTGTLCRAGVRAAWPPLPLPLPLRCVATSARLHSTAAHEDSNSVRPYEEMPGPASLPLIGSKWTFFVGAFSSKDLLQTNLTLKKQYGNVVKLTKLLNGKDTVMVYDPVEIEKVFRSEGVFPRTMSFDSLGYYRRIVRKEDFEGAQGLLNTNDKEWQDFRRLVQPHMLQPRAVAKYTEPIDTVASDFVEILKELRDDNGVLPETTINWFFRWSLESIAVIALDTRLGCLSSDVAGEPQQMIDAVQVLIEGLFELDFRPSIWRYVSTPMWRKYIKALDVFRDVSHRYMQQTMDRLKEKVAKGATLDGDLSVMEKLLLANDNPRVATTMANDMIVAGIDTTSYSTAALLYLLSRNPDKQEELHAELRRVLPEKDTPVTAERLADMKYLRAAIKESMRMLPVASGQVREITADGLTLGNYAVPKGAYAMLMTSITAVDPEYFPDADRFMPERWLKGGEAYKTTHPFASLPFGFGARMCIGKRFADLEIEVLAAKIIRNFRVEYDGEATFQTRFLYIMTSPLTFRLIDRD